jgi:hypothetical protein
VRIKGLTATGALVVPFTGDARERRALRLGVAGAVLAFLVLAGVQAAAVRPYLPPDELSHVGYAMTVLEGRLPTLTSPLPVDRVPLMPDDGHPRRVYVANHPPLFYAASAVPLWLGERSGAPGAGLLAARLLSATLAAAGLVMVAWLALVLVPERPRVAVGAAWLAALLPSLPHVSAFVYNDGLAFLAATAGLVAAASVVRRGPTPARLAGLAAAAAAAALTRAPGLALVALAGAAATAGLLLHRRDRPARRLLLAGAGGVLVAGVSGGLAIGFYLRNRSLYGSLTGAAYNQRLFGFVPQDHVLELLRSPAYALRLYDGLWVWTRFNLPRVPSLPALVAIPRATGLLVLAGLAVAAAGRLRGRRPAGPEAAATAAWALALAWPVAVLAMVAAYDGNGGHTHPRYLFPGLAVLAVVGAFGLDHLPGARRGLWALGPTLAQLVLTAAAWAAFVTALRGRRPGGPADLLGAVAGLLGAGGVAWPWALLVLAGALLVAALALLGLALARLAPRTGREAAPGSGGDGDGHRGWDGAWREELHAGPAPAHRAPTP